MSRLHIILADDRSRFLAYGGAPGGRDIVHTTVAKWPGWRRLRRPGKVPDLPGSNGIGAPCSIYSAPISALTASQLDSWTAGCAWSSDARNAAVHTIAALRDAKAFLEKKPARRNIATPTRSTRTPLPHQLQAMNAVACMGPRVLLADDMGLGKTATAIWCVWEHFAGPCRVLVVCPASVKFNWRREVHKALGDDHWVQVINGSMKQRADQIMDIHHHTRKKGTGYVIINYDLLIKLSDRELSHLALWAMGGALLCDESYYLKNRKSQRFKVVQEHFASAKGGAHARILMSGTPIRNRVDDLFSQVELIRPGTWTSYTDFCKRHLDQARIQFGQGPTAKKVMRTVGSKNLDKLNAVMNTLQIRRKKDDVLDLPPKVRSYPEIELSGPHLKMYKAMREWALLQLAELDDEDTVFSPQAQGAVQAAMRCEQIAQGFVGGVPDPIMEKMAGVITKHAHSIKGRQHELLFPESPKIAWLIETIECLWQQECRPIVFGKFNGPLVWLRHHFDKDSYILHGGQTAKMRDELIESFQGGDRRLMLCQVKIAEGFELTASNDEIFLSRDWSPAVNAQAEDRCHRIGQRGTVNIQIPIVTNSIEGYIHKKLQAKAGDAEAALQNITIAELRDAL